MTEVLIVKPGSIDRHDKAKLTKAGIVVVTAENPQDVRFVKAADDGGTIPGGDLLAAFARSILALPDHHQAVFASETAKTILARPEQPQ